MFPSEPRKPWGRLAGNVSIQGMPSKESAAANWGDIREGGISVRAKWHRRPEVTVLVDNHAQPSQPVKWLIVPHIIAEGGQVHRRRSAPFAMVRCDTPHVQGHPTWMALVPPAGLDGNARQHSPEFG